MARPRPIDRLSDPIDAPSEEQLRLDFQELTGVASASLDDCRRLVPRGLYEPVQDCLDGVLGD